MIILGGAYGEQVSRPRRDRMLRGSGVRAALAVAGMAPSLVTAVHSSECDDLDRADVPHLQEVIERDTPVSFEYFTPASRPDIVGSRARLLSDANVDADDVVAFGMIEEGVYTVRAKRFVSDPQSPRGASKALAGVTADTSVLSANAHEVQAMTRPGQSVVEAAKELVAGGTYHGVVVRCGARGSVAVDSVRVEWVPATPTMSVFSVGSGDTYTAVLAQLWTTGVDLVDAARAASNATAWWCSTQVLPVPSAILSGTTLNAYLELPEASMMANGYQPRVYLAAPFFTLPERWLVEEVRRTLEGLGAFVFSPLHDVGGGGADVASKDIDGLRQCDVIVALLDGFDPGTVYEAGWAARHGIPIVGYLHNVHDQRTKMMVGLGAEMHADLTSALYRTVWVGQGVAPDPGPHFLHDDEMAITG